MSIRQKEILGLFFIVFSILSIISLFGHDISESPNGLPDNYKPNNYLGYFALVNGGNQHNEGDIARLYSKRFPNENKKYCLNFWFYVSAPNVGAINVYKSKGDRSHEKLMWSWLSTDETSVTDVWTEGQFGYSVSMIFFYI